MNLSSEKPLRSNIKYGLFLLATCLFASGCDASGHESGSAAADRDAETLVAVANTAPVAIADQDRLVRPSSWMPEDWDPDVYPGSGGRLDPDAVLRFRQNMLTTVPFTLWAVANDTLVTEAFEPIWVWYTAIRSCGRGIQLVEDLTGEFGDRQRGRAALTQARDDLRAWASRQPSEMTLYFTATLGQWNETNNTFPLGQAGKATTLRPDSIASVNPDFDGARVELWTDRDGQSINHFQASLAAPQCAAEDASGIYKFERMSQWWVVFGDANRGMGGLVNYSSREMLPPITMTREEAASFTQRNAQRAVVVAVTFASTGSSFVKGVDQSAIRARFRRVEITDGIDGSVLASKTY